MKPRLTRRWALIAAVVATVIVVGAWLGHQANESVHDMYACGDLSRLIVHHLRQHRRWPRDWADLEKTVESLREKHRKIGGPAATPSIERLRARCDFNPYVDWDRLREDARKSDYFEAPIVWARKGNRFTDAARFGSRELVGWLRMLDDPNGDPFGSQPSQ